MKPQLFILGNLNGKTYYFTFGVLFPDLSYFPLLKPTFFSNFILKHFLKLRFFQNSWFFLKLRFFQHSGFFLKKTQMFSKLRVFFSNFRFFFQTRFFFFEKQVFYRLEQCSFHITAYHDCWLKENEQNGVDGQNGFYLFYASRPFR